MAPPLSLFLSLHTSAKSPVEVGLTLKKKKFFFFNLFRLCQILAAACEIFVVACQL